MPRIFFYGTLKSTSPIRFVNTESLHVNDPHPGSVNGRIFLLPGRGNVCFPAIRLGGSDVVRGEVVDVPEEMVPVLDHIEGYDPMNRDNLYRRVQVQTCEGEEVWIYEWAGDEGMLCHRIFHGSFDYVIIKTEGTSIYMVPMDDPGTVNPCPMYWPEQGQIVAVQLS